jgi:uroporphyrinogen decarboxylase
MEDLADRNGLTISPPMIEEFVLPYAAELAEIAQKHNIPVMFHSDGNVGDLLDMLTGIGVKAVNPMQPHLNNAAEFKNCHGDKLAVYGGLDNCYIIPDGTAEEVRAHVLDVFNVIGKPDGGLIFSTHDIPEYTPKENVEAMISAIKNECIY